MGYRLVVSASIIASLCLSGEAVAQDAAHQRVAAAHVSLPDVPLDTLAMGRRPFQRMKPKSVRRRDGNKDGLIKGALFGVLAAVVLEKGLDKEAEFGPRELGTIVAISAGTGYVVDALQAYREPLFRPGREPLAGGARFKLQF